MAKLTIFSGLLPVYAAKSLGIDYLRPVRKKAADVQSKNNLSRDAHWNKHDSYLGRVRGSFSRPPQCHKAFFFYYLSRGFAEQWRRPIPINICIMPSPSSGYCGARQEFSLYLTAVKTRVQLISYDVSPKKTLAIGQCHENFRSDIVEIVFPGSRTLLLIGVVSHDRDRHKAVEEGWVALWIWAKSGKDNGQW